MSEQSNNQGGGGTRSTTNNNNTRVAGNNRSGSGKGSGKEKNKGKRRNPNIVAAVPKPKFTGSCKKDLESVVIIHNSNKQVMTKQFIPCPGP